MNMKQYIYLLAITVLCSCSNSSSQEEASEEEAQTDIVELSQEQIETIGVTFGPIENRQMAGSILASGTLRLAPQNRADVTTLIPGIAKQILVKAGDRVHAGQTLALVENTEIVAMQKEYLVARQQALLAQSAYQRQAALQQENAGTAKNLEQAKAELAMAQATELGLRQQLQQLGIDTEAVAQGEFSTSAPIKAPISGSVGEVKICTGSYLSNETVLMNIFDNQAIHADLNVFESDIAHIHIGQEVDLQLPDHAGTALRGKVSFITASLDAESKSASVHVEIERPTEVTLLPNMFVSASIHCEESTCLAVPDEAIVQNAGRSYVFVALGDNRFQRSEVVTGITQQGYTQITFVARPTDEPQIITHKAFYLESVLADHGEED